MLQKKIIFARLHTKQRIFIMTTPAYLQTGDTIGITCPSGHLPAERVLNAKATLENWGYKVLVGQTVGNAHYYFSDTDERRLFELQQMLDNPDIKAILMGRGGYGLSRIIDKIDFTKFIAQPKWICGFSDITLLHSHIQRNFLIETLHSPMCAAFKSDNDNSEPTLSLLHTWIGNSFNYPIPTNAYNKLGSANGVLVGGNLAMLAHASGSASQLDTQDKILFLEDVGELLYNADRMLLNLKRAGLLQNIKALVCGGFSDMKDTDRPFGKNIYEIILDAVSEYDYPVAFDLPSGHIDDNFTLILGRNYQLEVADKHVLFMPQMPSVIV